MQCIKVEPRYYQAQGPPLSAKVSFVSIYPADWTLPSDNQRVLNSVFYVSSYILVLRYVRGTLQSMVAGCLQTYQR